MNRWIKLGLGLVGMGIIAMSLSGCAKESTDLVLTGSVEGNELTVVSQGAGEIQGLFVTSGEAVKKNQLIAQLDDRSLRIQKSNLELARQIAELKYQDLKNGNSKALIRQSIANRDQIKAQIAGSEKELSYLKKQISDAKTLVSDGATSKQQEDELTRALDKEMARYETLVKQLAAAQEGVNLSLEGAVTEKIKTALLEIQMKGNDLDLMTLNIDKLKVKSPSDGYIQTVNYHVGEVVAAGQKLFSIIDPSQLELKVYVTEKDLSKVSLGKKVNIQTDFEVKEAILGEVNYIASQAEFTPKNIESKESKQEMVFEVRISIEDPNHLVKPGMYLDANFGSDLND